MTGIERLETTRNQRNDEIMTDFTELGQLEDADELLESFFKDNYLGDYDVVGDDQFIELI